LSICYSDRCDEGKIHSQRKQTKIISPRFIMKKTLSLLTLCSALAAAHGDVVKFNLATNGLNVLNVVPAVTNSTGSGDAISGGFWLQTTNSTFTFAFGYGAGAGFTNLTAVAMPPSWPVWPRSPFRPSSRRMAAWCSVLWF